MDVSGENLSPVQPVAIVGVALRFPGAFDPLSFHDLTLSGRRLFQLGYGSGGGGISPGHALAAQAAAAAIADARLDRDWASGGLASRGRSGVIVASCPAVAAVPAPLVPPIGAWVEQRLGLAGPVPSGQWLSPEETAATAIGCSLRAVATACAALSRGEFDLMLAGGVAVGRDGDPRQRDIRVYDANPTGIAPGEGCGMVVLMRAADAQAAGLPAYAEIAGWSGPADGPDPRAVIRAAYLRAGVDPVDVQLIEGHGAATAADDQAELAALLDVLDRADSAGTGRAGAPDGCALGSVAANLGDTRGAAGMAALLKTSLAMAAATIPPATGCVEPHQLLRERKETLRLPRMAEEWPDIRVQLAGVNSLGAVATSGTGRSGGTHLVLRREQDPRMAVHRHRVSGVRGIPAQGGTRDVAPLVPSRPVRQATVEPGRPGHVVLPRPRQPQDFQADETLVALDEPLVALEAEAGCGAGDGVGNSEVLVRQEPPGRPAARPAQSAASYLRVQQLLARESAAIVDRLTLAKPAASATEPERGTKTLIVREWAGEAPMLVAVQGRDRADLITRLEEITLLAAAEPALRPASEGGARAALVASDQGELVTLARQAVEILRGRGPGPLRCWPQPERRRLATGSRPAAPGVYLSEGARGQVALVFGGLAWTSAEHVRTLSTSAATIEWARGLGIDARVAAGFGLGEIIGLAWAEAISHDDAARLAALRAEILRPMGGLTSMARVHADRETTARLLAGTQLVRAVDEGPAQQVVAGPLPSVRALPHRAVSLGVVVDLLSATCGLHSREMWPCVPPMAAIAAGTQVGPLRRRLISSVTGVDFALSGAPADLLARQLERPALLASAISLASADADLVLLATPETALAETAMSCCDVPVLLPPADTSSDPAPDVLAALFTAGVIDGARLAPGLAGGPGRVRVPGQASRGRRDSRPSRDRGASLTVG